MSPHLADAATFVYWGRRGSLSWLSLEIAAVLRDAPELNARLSYSSENELAAELAALGPATEPFRTFRNGTGALWRLPAGLVAMRRMVRGARERGVGAIIVLMSHVWTPFLGRLAHAAGLRYVVVAHEARGHPGDRTGRLHNWILRDLGLADTVVTLTDAVAADVAETWRIPRDRIVRLAHPVMRYGPPAARGRDPAAPLRVLFFGRIMAYKGLGLLIDAVARLRAAGIALHLGVVGEGAITSAEQAALAGLGAEVTNRWIAHAEIATVLAAWDVVVLPYREASQSGVTAAAFGAGLPVVVTPVGGLAEQVREGVDGLVAPSADAAGIAAALRRLVAEPGLYERLRAGAETHAGDGSVAKFVHDLLAVARGGP